MSKWTKIKNTIVFRNKWIQVDCSTFKLPNNKIADYFFVRGNPIVAVLGITKDKKVVMVKQYRPAIDQYMVDIPGGGVEDYEIHIQAARREFLEETGYELKNLRKLTSFYFDSGQSNKYSTIYVGRAINKKDQNQDGTEQIELVEIPYSKLLEDVNSNKKNIDTTTRLAILSLESKSYKKDYL